MVLGWMSRQHPGGTDRQSGRQESAESRQQKAGSRQQTAGSSQDRFRFMSTTRRVCMRYWARYFFMAYGGVTVVLQ
jgi:hypothetical protein